MQAVCGLSKGERDSLLSEALAAQGMSEEERITIYEAVRLAGEHAFESDLSLPL